MHPGMTEPNGEDMTPPQGLPAVQAIKKVLADTERHDSDITGLKGAVQTVVNEVGELRGEVAEVKGIALRVEAGLIRVTIPPPPPMRSELPSSVDPRELRSELKGAAKRGEKDPTTTAEAEVEKVLERVELIRRGRLFNKLLWLALTGICGFAADRIYLALTHH